MSQGNFFFDSIKSETYKHKEFDVNNLATSKEGIYLPENTTHTLRSEALSVRWIMHHDRFPVEADIQMDTNRYIEEYIYSLRNSTHGTRCVS